MYATYGNMDPINIPPMLAYIPAPWILWVGFTTLTKKIITKPLIYHNKMVKVLNLWGKRPF